MGKGIVTINTDAGFYAQYKKASYAYYIRYENGGKITGSGLFKSKCKNVQEAEFGAIINALYIVSKTTDIICIKHIIINRDNIHTGSKKNGTDLEKLCYKFLKKLFNEKCPHAKDRPYTFKDFYSFRHVKAHTKNNDARTWVNNWCDSECKRQLRTWKKEQENEQLL